VNAKTLKIAWILPVLVCFFFPLKAVQADAVASLSCSNSEQSGAANTIITYTCTLTNTGDAPATFSLSSAGSWNTWVSQSSVPDLAAGGHADFTVSVAIPSDAALGASSETTVTASAGSSSNTAKLVTRFVPPDPTATPSPTVTLQPTNTPPVTHPMVILTSYSSSDGSIHGGQEFTLNTTFQNTGNGPASNIAISFDSAQILPRDWGGVQTISSLAAGESKSFSLGMKALNELAGGASTVTAKVSYFDAAGTTYTDSYTITLGVNSTPTPKYSGAWYTSTPTPGANAQLIVSGYKTDVDPLQPGTNFNLDLEIHNLGNSNAKAVTLVLGGSVSTNDSGTPTAGGGGVSGAGGDVSKFAPLGSSNLYYLGDIGTGAASTARLHLIVNVTTDPGAYPLKLSFVYTDAKNNRHVDDQVITLLVYSLPNVDVSFYREPGKLIAGQPNTLNLQVVNLGRKTTVLGNVKVTGGDAEMQNNTGLVGSLESGGYFPLDAMITPKTAGKLDLDITINYTDDFNTSREIHKSLTVEVQDAPEMPAGMIGPDGKVIGGDGVTVSGMKDGQLSVVPEAAAQPETLWDKVVRFFKGLFGLGSGASNSAEPTLPEQPSPDKAPVVPVG
jgi:hypothetical protein